jgi:hypothetical protein
VTESPTFEGRPRWEAIAASTIGSVHVRDHRPIQDAVATFAEDDVSIIAVADGHGHHLHFRSDVGSRLAADGAVAALRAAASGWGAASVAEIADLLPDLGRGIHDTWMAAVHDHVAEHPFERGEETDHPLIPYGTTLVVLAVVRGVLLGLQVGDGDAVAARITGEAFRPLAEDERLDGVMTASLCQLNAMESLRTAAYDAGDENVVLCFACTDGFGSSRVDRDGWWRQTGEELVTFSRRHGLPWIGEQLPGWIEEPALVGGDDVSLAVLARGDLHAPDTVPTDG